MLSRLNLLFQSAYKLIEGKGLRAQIVRSSIASVAIKVLSMTLTLVLAILLARLLGPEKYGIYTYVFALVSLLVVPAQLGLPELVVRETAKAVEKGEWRLVRGLWQWASRVIIGISVALVTNATKAPQT